MLYLRNEDIEEEDQYSERKHTAERVRRFWVRFGAKGRQSVKHVEGREEVPQLLHRLRADFGNFGFYYLMKPNLNFLQ